MTLDDYFSFVRAFGQRTRAARLPLLEALHDAMRRAEPEAVACADLRERLLGSSDDERFSGFLETGFFAAAPSRKRLAWFALYGDIGTAAAQSAIESECDPYVPQQPLFVGAPDLLRAIRRRDSGEATDLIAEDAVASVDGTEIYRVPNGYARLSPHLPARIPNWARSTHPGASRFIRLDPAEHYATMPPVSLLEAAIVPADPTWLASLQLHPRGRRFASYELQNCDVAYDRNQYWEFHFSGVRRLEVLATRRKEDYLSFMLEELPRADDPSGLMIGRCIHADTGATAGTPITSARILHLDLAINVYIGPDRASRLEHTLQNRKSWPATCRTHLYRIEDVPLNNLFVFAKMFFLSRLLLSEWIAQALSTAA